MCRLDTFIGRRFGAFSRRKWHGHDDLRSEKEESACFPTVARADLSHILLPQINCPQYSVVQNYSTFEIRQYNSSSWVSTTVEGTSWKSSTSTGFMKLFKFISGANTANQKIDMTAPVTVKVSPGAGPNCDNEFTISFFLPYDLQGKEISSLPQPTDSTVSLRTQEPVKVAVRSYKGFSSDSDVTDNVQQLGSDLTAKQIGFKEAPYFTAGYDSPFRVFNRHNEVWLEVAE